MIDLVKFTDHHSIESHLCCLKNRPNFILYHFSHSYDIDLCARLLSGSIAFGFFLISGLPWIIWRQRTLEDLEKAPDVVYEDVLNEFDSTWGSKGLIVTRSNVFVTWKVRPHMDISWSPLGLRWFAHVWLYFGYSFAIKFLICAKKETFDLYKICWLITLFHIVTKPRESNHSRLVYINLDKIWLLWLFRITNYASQV